MDGMIKIARLGTIRHDWTAWSGCGLLMDLVDGMDMVDGWAEVGVAKFDNLAIVPARQRAVGLWEGKLFGFME